jgi:site-specific recombinase XerC
VYGLDARHQLRLATIVAEMLFFITRKGGKNSMNLNKEKAKKILTKSTRFGLMLRDLSNMLEIVSSIINFIIDKTNINKKIKNKIITRSTDY